MYTYIHIYIYSQGRGGEPWLPILPTGPHPQGGGGEPWPCGGDYLQDPPNSHIHRGEGGTLTMGGRGGPRTWNIYTYLYLYIYIYTYYKYLISANINHEKFPLVVCQKMRDPSQDASSWFGGAVGRQPKVLGAPDVDLENPWNGGVLKWGIPTSPSPWVSMIQY